MLIILAVPIQKRVLRVKIEDSCTEIFSQKGFNSLRPVLGSDCSRVLYGHIFRTPVVGTRILIIISI